MASPLLAALGIVPEKNISKISVELDPTRVIATCFKPADGNISEGFILRLWEVAGRREPLSIGLKGYSKAILTDLLEHNRKELRIIDDKVTINPNPYGFCALRLLP